MYKYLSFLRRMVIKASATPHKQHANAKSWMFNKVKASDASRKRYKMMGDGGTVVTRFRDRA